MTFKCYRCGGKWLEIHNGKTFVCCECGAKWLETDNRRMRIATLEAELAAQKRAYEALDTLLARNIDRALDAETALAEAVAILRVAQKAELPMGEGCAVCGCQPCDDTCRLSAFLKTHGGEG